jgi:hypothetical protein
MAFLPAIRRFGAGYARGARLALLAVCGLVLVGSPARAIDGGSLARASDRLARATVAIATLERPPGEIGVSRCSGVLIRPNVVLTAGHCVRNNPVGAAVVLYDGAKPVAKPHWVATVARYQIPAGEAPSSPYVHDIGALSRDVALLRLKTPVRGRRPIPFERAADLTPDRLILAAAGLSRSGVGTLRTAVLTPVLITDTGLTVAISRRARVCVGDSGGPVVVRERGRFALWGVASAVVAPDGPCGRIVVIAPVSAVPPG